MAKQTARANDQTVLMEVSTLTMDPITGLPVVLLTPLDWAVDNPGKQPHSYQQTLMPISIGLSEASAIATELDGIELELPTTHKLMSSLLRCAGVQVEWIEVYDLVDGNTCTRIHLVLPSGEHVVRDARPSDAIALALHEHAEIRVAIHVLEKVARLVAGLDLDEEEVLLAPAAEPRAWGQSAEDTDGDHDSDHGNRSSSDDEPEWPSPSAWDDPRAQSMTITSPAGGIIEGDLSQVSDEAFGKWKM